MKLLKNTRKISKFLVTIGWYQIFIKNYADLCEPLYQLKRKPVKFIWSKEAQTAFEKLKQSVTKAPVLKLPDFSISFELFTDASAVRVGAVLTQHRRAIAFTPRSLNKAERNYNVMERECLAVIWALNKNRAYFGSSLPLKVITYHAALTKLTNRKNLSSRMIKWALKLAEFNVECEHRPGSQNVVADVLSRNPVESIADSKIS
ncbi:retrovirus-related Pol polyprotein from transposon 17.6 [Trichonephila clavipes]|nr:retrovirus-related Pol polyprotein from transposon 17.6 [Trichonephila clavipes]